MKAVKRYIPDLFILLFFFSLVLFVFHPFLDGEVLRQGDIIQGKGMRSELQKYYDEEGSYPLWSNNMFGGMPTYARSNAMFRATNIFQYLNYLYLGVFGATLGNVLMCLISGFTMLRTFSISRWISVIGAVAFAFSNFLITSVEAGHNAKINSLAFIPFVLAGLYLLYKKNKMSGFLVVAAATAILVSAYHPQMAYYGAMLALSYVIYELVKAIKGKTVSDWFKRSLIALAALVMAIGVNFNMLYTNFTHVKTTIRGQSSPLAESTDKNAKTGGLDYEYATSWSMGELETLTLMVPGFMGGSSSEDRTSSQLLKDAGLPKSALGNIPTYWGDQPFTSGPAYVGIIICFLFLLYMFMKGARYRWWLLSILVFFIYMSWGRNSALYDFLFYNLPLFNKFRVPTMILLMVSIVVPLGAGLALHQIHQNKDETANFKALKYAAGLSIALLVVFGFLFSGTYSFTGLVDGRLEQSGWPMRALISDREAMLSGDALRSILLVLLSGALLFAYIKGKFKWKQTIFPLLALVCFDMVSISKRYIKEDDFEKPKKITFKKTATDQQILADNDLYYRVFDYSSNPFQDATAAYYHNSVGGYSAVKLRLYQDLIESKLSQGSKSVLNMLNTKYFIGQGKSFAPNPEAMGNAWVVSSVAYKDSYREEMDALDLNDLTQTAIVNSAYKEQLTEVVEGANNSVVNLISYHPEKLEYEANIEGGDRLVVFSEIYYNTGNDDWKVSIDGNESEIIRVNYALRGVVIPEGSHKISMRFEPKSFYVGATVSRSFSILFVVALLGFIFMSVKQSKYKAIEG